MSFSIRLTAKEKELASSYAKVHSISLSEAFKSALFEKIEEEYDIVLAEKSYKDYLKDTTTLSHEEMKEELGL